MIKFDVLNRFTGSVQFTAEIDCDESESRSVKLGLAVKWAVKNRANLYGANLCEANLCEANLTGANLTGANLYGASGINGWVKCIQIEQYPITYTDTVMQIGCERHSISEWAEFDDKRIAKMDGKVALKFWRKYKEWIFQTIELCPARPTGAEEKK